MPETTPPEPATTDLASAEEEGKYVYCIIKSGDERDFGAIGIGEEYAEAVGVLPSVARPQTLSSGDATELDRMRAENLELRRRLEEAGVG